MGSLVPVLIKQMAQAYPELNVQEQAIVKVITEEEYSFYRTLAQGIKRINQLIEKCKSDKRIPLMVHQFLSFMTLLASH